MIGGLLYCPCGRKWNAHTQSVRRKGVLRKTPLGIYRCPELHPEQIHHNCPRTIGSQKTDTLAWSKLVEAVNKPEVLIAAARDQIDELRANAEATLAATERIQNELDTLTEERQ